MQLTPSGLQDSASPAEMARLRESFAKHQAILLPGFVSPALLAVIERLLPTAEFRPRVENGVELEMKLENGLLHHTLMFGLNEPRTFAWARAVTGCGPVGCFYGRVFFRQRVDGSGHHYPWHDDLANGRMIGLSINLSRVPFSGGVFQLREKASQRMLLEHANTGYGDAMLFRVEPDLEHHVTRVTSDTPRLTFVGWFHDHSQPYTALTPGLPQLPPV